MEQKERPAAQKKDKFGKSAQLMMKAAEKREVGSPQTDLDPVIGK
eukprot:gene16345-4985_t